MSADVKQFVGTVFTFVGYAIGWTGWGVFFSAAGAALLYSGGKQRAKEAQEEARLRDRRERSSRSIKANVRGSSEVHYLCFGKVRVGGIICALGPGTAFTATQSRLYIGIAHSLSHAGGCEGVSRIWINEEVIESSELAGDPNNSPSEDARVTKAKYVSGSTYMVSFRHYRGTATQDADPIIAAEGNVKGRNGWRRGIAWTRFTLDRVEDPDVFAQAFPQGVPQLNVELKGIRCYDPRLDSTNGGAGSHRYANPTTWEWTQNPALIAATYMIMAVSDGGMGYSASADIDWASAASAASICDETLTVEIGSPTTLQPRYRCNIVLDSAAERRDNLQRILDTMLGARVRVGGKFKLYAGAYRSPTFTFDATYLRGGVTVATRSPLDQLYNAVRIVHDDESQNFRNVEAPPFTSSTYEAQDGGLRLWREETLQGVSNTYQAQYIAGVLGAMSRKQKIIECPCNLKALDIECWETGTVTLPELGISGAVYRVISWEWSGEGPKIVLREETSDVYTVSAFTTLTNASTPAVTYETPATPTGLTAAASNAGIVLRWSGPTPAGAPFIDIYRAAASGSPQSWSLLKAGVLGTAYHDEPSDSSQYDYKIQRRGRFGELSAFTAGVRASTGSVKIVASGAQLGDQRNGVAVWAANRTPAIASSATPLTSTDGPISARIDIAAWNQQLGFGQVSYNAGSITGLANSTLYYVYVDDPTFAGGAVTYVATTTAQNVVAGNGRIFVGSITTAADGGGGTSGGGYNTP